VVEKKGKNERHLHHPYFVSSEGGEGITTPIESAFWAKAKGNKHQYEGRLLISTSRYKEGKRKREGITFICRPKEKNEAIPKEGNTFILGKNSVVPLGEKKRPE